jgi:hypothetical protein
MSSVRQRLERQREREEIVVETAGRRTALGASGPTLSTRVAQQMRDDATEVLTPSPHTRTGGTDYMSGNLSRVRDRQSALADAVEATKPRPKTQAEVDVDEWLALETRRQAEATANQRPTVNAQERRIAEARASVAAADAKAKQAQHSLYENLVLREISDLDAPEQQLFWERFATFSPSDVGAASVIAEGIRLTRNQEQV